MLGQLHVVTVPNERTQRANFCMTVEKENVILINQRNRPQWLNYID